MDFDNMDISQEFSFDESIPFSVINTSPDVSLSLSSSPTIWADYYTTPRAPSISLRQVSNFSDTTIQIRRNSRSNTRVWPNQALRPTLRELLRSALPTLTEFILARVEMCHHDAAQNDLAASSTPSLVTNITGSVTSLSTLSGDFKLYQANPELWLQIEANKRKIRENDKLSMLVFENGKEVVKFQNFRILPLEIREMIWKFAARQQRVIEVLVDENGLSRYFPTQTLVPAIVHATSESRRVGRKFYTEFSYCLDRYHCIFWRRTFVSFETDILLFESSESMKIFVSSDLPCCYTGGLYRDTYLFRRFKHLAVAAYDSGLPNFINGFPWGLDGIPTFDRLDSLYIIRSFEGGTSTTGSLAFTKVHSYDTEIAVIAQKFEQRIRKSTVAKTSLRPSIKIVDAYRDDYVLSPPKTTEALLAELKD